MDGPFTEDSLTTAEGVFGNNRLWFVRESYISLYDAIMKDDHYYTKIVNGSAVNREVYISALHACPLTKCWKERPLACSQRHLAKHPQDIYFPSDGRELRRIERSDSASAKTLSEWYQAISEDSSDILIDWIVLFTLEDYPNIKYVAANSPSCSIGWMDKA